MASDRYPGLRLAILSAAVVATAAAAAPAGAARGPGQPGSLDAGFGNQGKVVRTVGSESAGEGIVTLPSGRIMLAGYSDQSIVLMRFTAAGHLDPSFSGDGKVLTSVPGKGVAADALAVDSNGRIVVAGIAYEPAQVGSEDVLVARYLPNGQPDTTFGGGDGRVIVDMFGGDDIFQDMDLGADDKPVVALMADQNGTFRGALMRFTTNGTLDNSFSGDGKVVLPKAGEPFVEAVTVMPSLKVVTAGIGSPNGNSDFVLYGFNKNGTRNQNFGTFGVADTDFDEGTDVADVLEVDARGRIVAGGQADVGGDSVFALARYTRTGQPDVKFSGDGKAFLDLGAGFDRIFAMTFQGAKILAGGRSDDGEDPQWAVARFGGGGSPDMTWGTGGMSTVNFSTNVDLSEEVTDLTFLPAVQRVVGCGYTGDRLALAGFVG